MLQHELNILELPVGGVNLQVEHYLRLPHGAAGLLVVTRNRSAAHVGDYWLGHPAVGTAVMGEQDGFWAVISAIGDGVEVRGRRDARGDAVAVPGEDLCCLVPTWLGRAEPAQTPGAVRVRLPVELLLVVHRAARQVWSTRRSVRSPHPPPPPVVPRLEHVLKRGVQHPVVALPLPTALPGNLDETLIQRQVVSNAVLPTLLVLLVVGELGCDVVVYSAQSQSFGAVVLDGHGDQSHVGVRRLLRVRLAAPLATFGLRRRGRVGAEVQKLQLPVG